MSLIPKNKFDFETVERLEKQPSEVITPLLPKLFEWIVDPNWPIALRLGKIIAQQGKEVIPYCKHYINNSGGNDEYCFYYVLLPLLDDSILKLLECDLKRVIENPSEYEKLEELDVIARRYVK